ncbi:MAG: apolipoprotein N-acyltransferase, partial [Alphaproteobacteria bacterium]
MRIWRIADAALAAGAGVAAAFGFPPNGIGWLTLAALAIFAWRLPGASPRRAASLAWLFAAAWHFSALSWVSEAFRVTFPDMGAISYLPVVGLAAGLALFWTLAVYLWRRFWPAADRGGAPAFLGLAAALGLGEWLMGHVFTGFPWALTALAFAEDPMLA